MRGGEGRVGGGFRGPTKEEKEFSWQMLNPC